jgi:hypothetical protein
MLISAASRDILYAFIRRFQQFCGFVFRQRFPICLWLPKKLITFPLSSPYS